MQLRFGTRFESKVVFFTVADNFLNYRTHLVDLDGVDDKVFSFEFVFFGSACKALRGFFDTVVQYVGKSEQHRRGDVARVEFVDHFFQVDANPILAR